MTYCMSLFILQITELMFTCNFNDNDILILLFEWYEIPKFIFD